MTLVKISVGTRSFQRRIGLSREAEQEDAQAREASSRKRTAARAPGAYEGMDTDDVMLSEKKSKPAAPRRTNAQKSA